MKLKQLYIKTAVIYFTVKIFNAIKTLAKDEEFKTLCKEIVDDLTTSEEDEDEPIISDMAVSDETTGNDIPDKLEPCQQ